jgi:hypothetical protein
MEGLNNDLQMTIQIIDQYPIDSPEFKKVQEEAKRLEVSNAFRMHEFLTKLEGQGNNQSNVQQEKLLNTEEIGKYFGLTKKTIRELTRRGVINGMKIPPGCTRGIWRYKISDVEQGLLASRRKARKTRKIKAPELW